MYKIIRLSFLLLLTCSCAPTVKKIELAGLTMGTTYHITYFSNRASQKKVHEKVNKLLVKLNNQMSTYIKTSEISLFNQSKKNTWHKISPWFLEVTKHALSVARKSKGVFDPTIGPLVNLWGFGPNKKRKVPSTELILKTKKYVNYLYIKLDQNKSKIAKTKDHVMLDLSASAKGFGVDVLSRYFDSLNIKEYLIEIGGEIKVKSGMNKKKWKLAIQSPNIENFKKSIHKVISLKEGALATSGNYRNFFKENNKLYSHTMNYKTGMPVQNSPISVSVIDSKSCMNADALATLLMSLKASKAIEYIIKNKIKAYVISLDKDGVQKIDNFLGIE